MKLILLLSALLAMDMAYVPESRAAPVAPSTHECTSARELEGYRAGWISGSFLAKRVWASIDDCARIREFVHIMAENVVRLVVPEDATDYVKCRILGTREGIVAETIAISETCYPDDTGVTPR